jgi:ferritin
MESYFSMKLSSRLEKALNDQLNLEQNSAFAYLGMAAHFENTPFEGFSAWMRLQYKEELGHAEKFFGYLNERGGKITLMPIAAGKSEYASPLEVFRTALGHEQKVSAAISAIYELALQEKDYPTLSFLKWFLDEQVEEEKSVNDMIAKLELIGENHNGLFHLDKLAGKRGAQ